MSDGEGDRRAGRRGQCFAHVMLRNSKAIGYIADMGERGFKVRIMEKIDRDVASRETVGIQFDEFGVPYFQLNARLCWRKDEEKSTLLGFELESFETEEAKMLYEKIRTTYGA